MNRIRPMRSRANYYLWRSLKRNEVGKNNIQQLRWHGNYGHPPLDSNGTLWATKTVYRSYPQKMSSRVFSSSSSPPPPSPSSSDEVVQEKKESEEENSISMDEDTEKITSENSTEEEQEQKDDLESNNKKATTSTSKQSFFPWRHVSSLQPLPRVLEENDLSGLPLNSRSKFVRKVLVGRELDAPWLEILFTKTWEKELAEKFAWAFQKAVAGAISRTFQVPMDQIEDEETGFINFDTTTQRTKPTLSNPNVNTMTNESEEQNSEKEQNKTIETETDVLSKVDTFSDSEEPKSNSDEANEQSKETTVTDTMDNNNDGDDDDSNDDDDKKVTNEMQKETDEFVSAMLEESLLNLYQPLSVSESPRKWGNMKFQMKPLRWRLESAFVIPMFTRDDVKAKPKLKGSYQAIEKEFANSGNVKMIREMGDQLAEETQFSGKRVIIADVSVDCLESIQFIDDQTDSKNNNDDNDSETKEQDMDNNELTEVTHLVRFEMVTSKDESTSKRQIGSWQIIDWDDMLEGNIWH